MKDIKILFEVNNNEIILDIDAESPEVFIAGVAYMIEKAGELTGLDSKDMTDAILNVVTTRKAGGV